MGNLPDSAYWRYKKKKPPTDEFASKNGEVKVIKKATVAAPKPNKPQITTKPKKRQRLPEPYRSEYREAMQHLRSISSEQDY